MENNTEHEKIYPYSWGGDYEYMFKIARNFDATNELAKAIQGMFYIKVKISNIMDNVYVNGKAVIYRNKKFSPVQVSKNCKILEGKPTKEGGSNTYPRPAFENGYCIAEITTDEFPVFIKTARMDIEVLELKKIPL